MRQRRPAPPALPDPPVLTAHASCGNKWLTGQRMSANISRKAVFGVLSWNFHRFQLVHELLHVCLQLLRCKLPAQTKVIDTIGVVQTHPSPLRETE